MGKGYVKSPVTISSGFLFVVSSQERKWLLCAGGGSVWQSPQNPIGRDGGALAGASGAGGLCQGSLRAVTKAWGGVCGCSLKMLSLTGKQWFRWRFISRR